MAANKSKSDVLALLPLLFVVPPEALLPELELPELEFPELELPELVLPLLFVVFEVPDDEALADACACC